MADDPTINQMPDPAAFASAGPRKKFKKRKVLEDPGGLTMNSLMDIMTIILVFLLKSYATDPVQLKAAPDLKPPFSTAQIKPVESTVITVTMNSIVVDDAERPVRLSKGQVPAGNLAPDGLLINDLFATLNKAVEHHKKVYSRRKNKKFEGIVTIVADRHIPFRLLSQVLYTAGLAKFGKFKFMVVKDS